MFYANIQVMYNPSYSQLKDLHVYAGKNGQNYTDNFTRYQYHRIGFHMVYWYTIIYMI